MDLILYKNNNQQVHEILINKYEDFEIFVKTNIIDLLWARFYRQNILIEEFNSTDSFSLKYIDLKVPKEYYSEEEHQYAIFSCWHIRIIQDFLKKHQLENEVDFWKNPELYQIHQLNKFYFTLYDKNGENPIDESEIQHSFPSDLIWAPLSYLEKEFYKVEMTVLKHNLQDDYAKIHIKHLRVGL